MNASYDQAEAWQPHAPTTVLIAQVMMFLAIASVNVLTLVVMAKTPKLRTIPNTYIGALAVSDLVVSLNQLLAIPWAHPRYHGYFEQNTGLCLFFKCLLHVNELTSIFTIALIGLDRFVYIRHPFWYIRVVTKTKVKVAVAVVWVASFLIALPIRLARYPERYPGCDAYALLYDSALTGQLHGALYFVICAWLFASYGVVIHTALRQARAIQAFRQRQHTRHSPHGCLRLHHRDHPHPLPHPHHHQHHKQQEQEEPRQKQQQQQHQQEEVSVAETEDLSVDTALPSPLPCTTTPTSASSFLARPVTPPSSSSTSLTPSGSAMQLGGASDLSCAFCSTPRSSSSSFFTFSAAAWPAPEAAAAVATTRGGKASEASLPAGVEERLEARLSLRIVKKMAGVFLVLFVCWTPYAALGVMDPKAAGQELVLMVGFLAAFNSAANFGVYALADRDFRVAMGRILCRRRQNQGHRPSLASRVTSVRTTVLFEVKVADSSKTDDAK